MITKSICNYCGKEMDFFDVQQEIEIHKQIKYGSVYDGEKINIKLCCDCLDKIISECKIDPIQKEDL